MKTGLTFFTLVFVCSFMEVKGQNDPISDERVKRDSIFVDSLAIVYKANPLNVENFRLKFTRQGSYVIKREEHEKLGFEYDFVSGYNNGGYRYGGYCYVDIFYKFVYFKNKLVSFRLEPQMPDDKRLTDRYLKIYAHLFKINNNSLPEPLNYNYDELCKPLPDYEGIVPKLNKDIKFFMTPFTGIEYVTYGGDPNHLLGIRLFFEKIKENFTPEICELLMYSKNAATRLYAIEYYYRNEKLFIESKARIEQRIKIVYDEVPEIRTHYSDVYSYGKVKQLVDEFVKEEH